jgi:hypothetical protein
VADPADLLAVAKIYFVDKIADRRNLRRKAP